MKNGSGRKGDADRPGPARCRTAGACEPAGTAETINNASDRQTMSPHAARSSESWFRMVADFASDWEYWINPEGRFLYISPSAETILRRPVSGYTEIAALLREVVHPDDLPARLAHLSDELKGNGPSDMDFRIVWPDGEVRWINHVCRPVYNGTGTFLGIRGSNRDVTLRHAAEDALELSNKRLAEVLESIQDDFYVLDRDWVFVFANSKFTSRIGKRPEDFIGRCIWELFPKHLGTIYEGNLRAAMEQRETRRFEIPGQYTDAWYSMKAFPSAEGVTVLGSDITKRRKTEEALKESEEKYRTIVETMTEGIWIVDADRRTTYVNRQMAAMLGYSPGEMLGKSYRGCVDDESAAISDTVTEERKRGIRGSIEFRLRKKDGTPLWAFVNSQPLFDSDGNFAGSLSLLSDITTRKKTEDALRQIEAERAVAIAVERERRRLYEVLEALPVYVCLLDEDYRMPFANRYFRENFREPAGRRCHEFLFNRDTPCENCETYKVMKTRAPHHWFWTGPNGRDYDIYDYPFTDSEGSLMILEMGIDITDRKRAEEERAILASIVEHSEDAIIGKSLTGIILSWNAGAAKMYGYSAEEAIGRHVSMLLPLEREYDLSDILEPIRQGVPVIQRDSVRMKKDGQLIHVSLTISPIKDRNGMLIGASTIARDISERKKVEDTIEKANAYNRSLIEASLDPLVTIAPNGTISDVNEATIRVTGCSRDELIGTDFSNYFTEPAKAKAGYTKAFRDGLVTDYALEIRHRDGSVTPVLYNASVYRDALGNVIGVFASARDITERMKAEEALGRANAYNRSLIETSLDPLVTIAPNGTISDVNEATIRVTGYSRDELIGTDFSNYFTEPARAKAGYETVFRYGSVTGYELEIRHRDGRVTPVLYNASVYRDALGNVIGVFASARDITDRKTAEKELRKAHDLLEKRVKERTQELVESNALLKEEISQRRGAESLVKKTVSELHAAIESTADGIYVVDRTGHVIRYNQNFASMWQVPQELLASGKDKTVSGYLRTLVKNPDLFRESDDHSPPKDRETYDMLELKDGRVFERYSKPQKMDQSIIGRVLSYRDVTDRKRSEEKILASLQEKEILIREIHHRVKNNLQIISGLLDMTRMRTKDGATTEILTDMMMKIKTMAQIHTRLYESKQVDKINMGGQIRDQVADISNIYRRSGPDITCHVDAEDLNLPVDQAIPCALVVNEALSNSFKHAFKGRRSGTILITARLDNGMIHIRIQDDGIGIPEDVDIDRATSLGLKLIRNLVQQLRGTLTIEHLLPGTAMNVSFPLGVE
ncbi:PAS domain S-box protein [Methanoregula sp.]|uniref:PAS domain S-box protein n=1 Tax=Methanoregula sp. TaxID=2052170 RepID=UPI0026373680|nr:PAS domain S-box protein [Methanoregula sp.]MDD5142341.1 PAS domain S-box protein [Methanoregula sp.]